MKLRTLLAVSILTLTSVVFLGTASSAQARTVCKNYDRYTGSGYSNQSGTLCAAPASDYVNYHGWLGVVTEGSFTSVTNPCGFSLFPYDYDDPMPMIGCPAVMPPPVPSWTWTQNRGWTNDAEFNDGFANAVYPGAEVYVYPFTKDWRWIYAKRHDGTYSWHAIEAKYVALRWFTSHGTILR